MRILPGRNLRRKKIVGVALPQQAVATVEIVVFGLNKVELIADADNNITTIIVSPLMIGFDLGPELSTVCDGIFCQPVKSP